MWPGSIRHSVSEKYSVSKIECSRCEEPVGYGPWPKPEHCTKKTTIWKALVEIWREVMSIRVYKAGICSACLRLVPRYGTTTLATRHGRLPVK